MIIWPCRDILVIGPEKPVQEDETMKKIIITTDSNSGISQAEAARLGIHVLPMPFYINGQLYLEDLTLSQPELDRKSVV